MDRTTRDTQFEHFVLGHRDRLVRLAYLLCGSSAQAEDIVQTALAKLYVAWHRVDRNGNVDAYARRVLVRTHLDVVKRSATRHESAWAEVPEAAAKTGVTVEERDALMRALLALPPGQRRVVVLRYYWQLDVAETAADLGCAVGTVKSQSAKALARLSELLSPTDANRGA